MVNDDVASIAVIGGGVAGIVATYRLLQQGHRVRLFEAESSLGGQLRTFEIGGEPIECLYQRLLTSDGAVIRLLDELTLLKTLKWQSTTAGIFCNDRVYPFTSTLDLLRFTPLAGIRDRIRLGLVGLRLRREREGSKFEGVTAMEWMRRNAGERNLRVVWEPLLRGQFGEVADDVPMTWLWNRIRLRFSSRGLSSQKELFGYEVGSFGVWIKALVKLIEALGGEIATNEAVQRVVKNGETLRVETARDRGYNVDSVLATISNQAFLRIAPPLGEQYTERLRGIASQDALCLVLTLNRPLTRHYWVSINDRSVPFVAIVEQTNLIPPERYGGRHVVYLTNYVPSDSPLRRMSRDELFALYSPHLKRVNLEFDDSWVTGRWLFHVPDARPVYTLVASSTIPDHRMPIPGVYLANLCQMYPQDRGQNYSIVLGEEVAAMIGDDLSRRGTPGAGLGAAPAQDGWQ